MTSLKDIIEEIIIESKRDDSILKNITAPLAYKYGKEYLKKSSLATSIYTDVMNVEIPFACKVFKAPNFLYVLKVELLNCGGRTVDIRRSNAVPTQVQHYLLQCDGNLITDINGVSLADDCITCNEETFKCSCGNVEEKCICHKDDYLLQDCETQQLLHDIKKYKDSWYADKKGYIQFSSDLEGLSVLITYMSNDIMRVDECDLYVPENRTEALEYYVKYKLLEGGIDTINQSQYYKREYKRLERVAISQDNPILERDLKSLQFYK